MNNIEIHNINELILQGYPREMIKQILEQVLILSVEVKKEYPEYNKWFLTTQVPGLYDNTRNIIVAHNRGNVIGFSSLKKTDEEKKLCTFYVDPRYRFRKIGSVLMEKSIEYLEVDKPLLTIPMNKLHQFIKIANKYNWEIAEIKKDLYRNNNNQEIIINGELKVKKLTETVNKSFFYK